MIEVLTKITDKPTLYSRYYYNTHRIPRRIYYELEEELTREYSTYGDD